LDGSTAERCPWLWELLTLTKYADGTPRIVADLSIQAGVGCWMVTLRCHSEALSLVVPVPELAELGPALEGALMAPVVPWRPYESWRRPEQPSTNRRKK
jgi:hypothetical protein